MGERKDAVLNGFLDEILAVKKAVMEFLVVAEKARDVHVEAEKKVC